MTDSIEVAASGRAKCRACGKPLAKGELRFGERAPNPFAAEEDVELTYWFHVDCAAYRRSERFVTLTREQLADVRDAERLIEHAKLGVEHHRVPRIAGLEHAKSGRAKCRHCKEVIESGALRIPLTFWEEGRMGPSGFVHLTCARAYFETNAILPWLHFTAHDATQENLEAIRSALG